MNCIFVFKITFEIVDKNRQYYYLFRTSKMVVAALALVNSFKVIEATLHHDFFIYIMIIRS